MPSGLVGALVDALGADSVLTEPADLAHYGSDRAHGGWPVRPVAVARVGSTAEVQRVVRLCAEHGGAIVPSGGRTGLCGGATATDGEVVLSMERMSRILEVEPVGRFLRCEAGATVQAVQDAARDHGLAYPIAFAAQGSAQIGGTIATNAGGVRVIRYGSTRAWVMGLRVVVASGEVLDLGGPLLKDNTGYDLKQLFIGAEGTLGVVVEATLALCAPPPATVVAMCAVPDDARTLEVLDGVRVGGLRLQAFECFDRASLEHVLRRRGRDRRGPFAEPSPQHVLLEVEVEEQGSDAEARVRDRLTEVLGRMRGRDAITDAVVAATPKQAAQLWSLREEIGEVLDAHEPYKADVSVPVAALPRFVAAVRAHVAEALPDVECVVFGHVGDGNLHVNLLRPTSTSDEAWRRRVDAAETALYELVGDHGGSISAEHGIGLLKRAHLRRRHDDATIAAMRAVKRALDPQGLFNPGKIFE